jgi:hypothetical protein
MKVKDLISKLQAQDPEREVILSKDGEGNEFSPLCDVSTAAYSADTTWAGSIGLEPGDLTNRLRDQGYSEDDIAVDGTPALVLWPAN